MLAGGFGNLGAQDAQYTTRDCPKHFEGISSNSPRHHKSESSREAFDAQLKVSKPVG